MLVDESRNVVAHVENEPNREKPGDAVEIGLQKIANNVAIEQAHQNQFRV